MVKKKKVLSNCDDIKLKTWNLPQQEDVIIEVIYYLNKHMWASFYKKNLNSNHLFLNLEDKISFYYYYY